MLANVSAIRARGGFLRRGTVGQSGLFVITREAYPRHRSGRGNAVPEGIFANGRQSDGYGNTTMVIFEKATVEKSISKSRFRARALEIFRRVERTGEPVVITDRGNPTLVINRYSATADCSRNRLKGSVLRYDAPFDPVGEGDWNALL